MNYFLERAKFFYMVKLKFYSYFFPHDVSANVFSELLQMYNTEIQGKFASFYFFAKPFDNNQSKKQGFPVV